MNGPRSRPSLRLRRRVLLGAGALLLIVLAVLGLQRDRLLLVLHPERRIVGQWRLYSASEMAVLDSHFPLRYGFEVVLDEEGALRVPNIDGLGLDYDRDLGQYRLREADPTLRGNFRSLALTGPDTVEIELRRGSILQYRRYVPESNEAK